LPGQRGISSTGVPVSFLCVFHFAGLDDHP